ncbi:MAG: hypothetical protein IPG50_21975 [Myxococcales bacterium]|nr:hypothetical protein [Myxococcales bacterium]
MRFSARRAIERSCSLDDLDDVQGGCHHPKIEDSIEIDNGGLGIFGPNQQPFFGGGIGVGGPSPLVPAGSLPVNGIGPNGGLGVLGSGLHGPNGEAIVGFGPHGEPLGGVGGVFGPDGQVIGGIPGMGPLGGSPLNGAGVVGGSPLGVGGVGGVGNFAPNDWNGALQAVHQNGANGGGAGVVGGVVGGVPGGGVFGAGGSAHPLGDLGAFRAQRWSGVGCRGKSGNDVPAR